MIALLVIIWMFSGYIGWFLCTKEDVRAFDNTAEEVVFFTLFLLPLCLCMGPFVWVMEKYLRDRA